MNKNIGTTDKIVRILLAIILGGLIFSGVLQGTAGMIAGIVAVILVLTSLINFCPIYAPFKLSTRGKKQA